MINHAALITCFQSLVGWRTSTVADAPEDWDLPETLTTSASGLYFSDAHELMRLEVIADIKPETEPMFEYLQRITSDAIIKVLNNFVVTLTDKSFTKALLENRHVVKGAGHVASKETKSGRFVGFEISLKERNYVTTALRRIGLQLDTAQIEPLGLYIYSDNLFTPLTTITLDHSVKNTQQWFDLTDVILNSVDGYNRFYIGYYEDDLTGQAIKKEYDGGPCGCADDPYYAYSQHFSVKPFSIPAESLDSERNFFDSEAIVYEQSNFGLNFEPVVYCDLSRVICQNKFLFAKAVQLMVVNRVLQGVIDTPEVNRITQSDKANIYATQKQLQLELFGGRDENGNYYKGEIGKLSVDFSGLDEPCLPKRNVLSVATIRR